MKTTTEKIKVTVSREEVKELEITFPYFTKNRSVYCKFFSKDMAIWVSDFGFDRSVSSSNGCIPDSWLLGDTITENEFNAKFNEVMTDLIEKLVTNFQNINDL